MPAALTPVRSPSMQVPRPGEGRIGQILADQGAIGRASADRAARQARRFGMRLGDYLVRSGAVTDDDLLLALSTQSGLAVIDLEDTPPEPGLFDPADAPTLLREGRLPWRRTPVGVIEAVSDPYQVAPTARRVLASPHQIRAHLGRMCGSAIASWSEHSRQGDVSCRSWRPASIRRRVFVAMSAFVLALVAAPAIAGLVLVVAALMATCLNLGLRVAAAHAFFRHRRHLVRRSEPNVTPMHALPAFTLLVPLHREAAVVPRLAVSLAALDYPEALVDVVFLTEHDDADTRRALAPFLGRNGWASIIVPPGGVRTKPRAMNYALPFCRGAIVGVYDAEDRPDPGQLGAVAARFAAGGVALSCVQCALGFFNEDRNWIARAFSIEYTTWFRLMLPGIAAMGLPVPLGGTSVFLRRHVLEDLDGWDAWNVTEDAELGILLARRGHRTAVLPNTTLEEVNFRPLAWIRQRSRWLKGFAITWIVHNRSPRALWRDLGPAGFLAFQTMTGSTVLSFLLAPVMWSLWPVMLGWQHPFLAALPPWGGIALASLFLLLGATQIAMQAIALATTGKARLIRWLPVMPAYWPLATVAAWRAATEVLFRPFYWSKTEHGIDG